MPAKLNQAMPEMPASGFKTFDEFQSWFKGFHQATTNHIRTVQKSMTPATATGAPRVTPIAAALVVDFERTDGDRYLVYHSTTANFADAAAVDVGISSRWFDQVGKGGVKKTYWIVTIKNNVASQTSPPASGTSLAIGTAATLPSPLPPNDTPVKSDETGHTVSGSGNTPKIGR